MIELAIAMAMMSASVTCNFDNYLTSEVCTSPPATFDIDADGNFTGELESGVPFSQTNIVNGITRLQRFTLQDYYHFVSDKGVIMAETDIQALSVYLTR